MPNVFNDYLRVLRDIRPHTNQDIHSNFHAYITNKAASYVQELCSKDKEANLKFIKSLSKILNTDDGKEYAFPALHRVYTTQIQQNVNVLFYNEFKFEDTVTIADDRHLNHRNAEAGTIFRSPLFFDLANILTDPLKGNPNAKPNVLQPRIEYNKEKYVLSV